MSKNTGSVYRRLDLPPEYYELEQERDTLKAALRSVSMSAMAVLYQCDKAVVAGWRIPPAVDSELYTLREANKQAQALLTESNAEKAQDV